MQFVDLVGDELRFVVTRVAGVTDDLVAVTLGRPKVLVWAIEVVRNHRVGGLQNVVGRSVVLLEQNHLCAWKVFFELDNVANVCATERVDRLVAVAHDGKRSRWQNLTGARVDLRKLDRQRLG